MIYSLHLVKASVALQNPHDYNFKLLVVQVFRCITWQIYLAPLSRSIFRHDWTSPTCVVKFTYPSLGNTAPCGTPPGFHSWTQFDSKSHPILFVDSRCDWRCRSFHHIFKGIVSDCKINLACAHSKVAAKLLGLPSLMLQLMFKLTLAIPAFVQEECLKC